MSPSSEEWSRAEHVDLYLSRADEIPHRAEGESVLLEAIPRDARRVLDLGTGDGRLLALLRAREPATEGVGLDSSELMLERARARFEGEDGLRIARHDLAEPLPDLGPFDAVVSSFAIHHLEHERKRALCAEAFGALRPGGAFVNLEHVASPSRRLHEAFFAAISEPLRNEDPSDRLLDVETQVAWLREIGFEDADCLWKWRELALLAAVRPRP